MATTEDVTVSDRQQIFDIILRYFWLVDHGRADETGAFFADDAQLTFGPGAPKPGTIEGAAIPIAMRARAKQTEVTTRHVLSNIILTVRDANTVEANALLTLFRSNDEHRGTVPASVADIEDIYVRSGESWKIHRRRILPVFNRVET